MRCPRTVSITCALALAMSASGCSVIGFVGGTGVDLLSKHPTRMVSRDSLSRIRDGSSVTLTLLDSTTVEGEKLRARASDYDSTASLARLRLRRTAKSDSLKGETLVVPVSRVAIATARSPRNAGRRAAAAGIKPDIVAFKVVLLLGVAAALFVMVFGLILSSSGFSF